MISYAWTSIIYLFASLQVYQRSAKGLVDIAINGGFSTAMVYGQTGSGKTYTMASFYEKAVRDIFDKLAAATERFSANMPTVSVSFYEVHCPLLCGVPSSIKSNRQSFLPSSWS